MTAVSIRIPMPLRSYTGGKGEVQVEANTVGEALNTLAASYDGLQARVLSPEGGLRQFVNVFIGNRNIRSLDGFATPLSAGDVISIVPAVAGGCTTIN